MRYEEAIVYVAKRFFRESLKEIADKARNVPVLSQKQQ